MQLKSIISIFLVLLCTSEILAQENLFLSRDYWKTNPSIEQIERDIENGSDPEQLNKYAFDAVVFALLEKVDNKTVKFLLSKPGNDVNKITHDGRTYIFWAAYKDNLEMMQYLVDRGAKTDIIDSHGYSLLNFAAVTGQLNTKLYDFCLANGSNLLEEYNKAGANALLLVAPFLKDTMLIDYFLIKGIDLKSTDHNGNGIFDYASKKGNLSIMKKLINMGVLFNAPTKDGANAMIFASRGTRNNINSLETFKYLESLGIAPNTTTTKGFTPLHALSFKNKDLSIFQYFIEKGVDINQKDEDGNTAFLNAVSRNDLKTVQFLAPYVKNINTINKGGKTALMLAIRNNSLDVVEFLLEQGADIKIKDKKGNSLAYYLVESYQSENEIDFEKKLKALEKVGAKISEIQANGNSLYHLAVKKSSLSLLKKLETLDIPLNTKNDEGMTALHIAAMKATNSEILKFLIAKGADKEVKTSFDETVFDLASENELLQKKDIELDFLQF